MHRGGGNARITSHNQGFSLIKAFNNLALWGEKKFVSELKRTYKFKRGVNNILDCHANQTRILSKEYSFVAGDYVRSTAQEDENLNRLRNKCAMTDYGHAELVSVSCGLNPSPAFQAPSPQVARGKIRRIGNMKENIFSNMVYSLFTTHHSLRKAAFTLAEVLVTLGIIGVVSAMTVPTLMQNYQRQSYVTQLHKVYNELSQALVRYQNDKNAVNLREAGLTGANAMNSFITTYLKVVKDCGNDFSACFGSDYKKINGTSLSFGEASSAAGVFVLAGGQSIAIFSRNSDSQQYSNSIATILVDVNGKKGPNIQGRDFYQMDIYSTDGGPVIDEMIWNVTTQPPFTEAQRNTQFNSYCVAGGSGNFHGCFGKILNDNWQMNY